MDHTIIAQAVGSGAIFRIRMPVVKGSKEADFFQEREVAVILGLDEETGRAVFTRVSSLPSHLHIGDLPEIPVELLDGLDFHEVEGAKLTTVRKKGSSKPAYSVQTQWENRGAIPGYKMPK